MLGKLKERLKGPLTERMYRYLMREAQYHWGRKPFGPEELKLLNEALVSQTLFGVDGKMVNSFEKEFAQAYNVPYAVASTSGTAAIHTALGVLDLNPGDEVITAPITDLGTIIPILSLNAIPVFADVDQSYLMDPKDVERKITPRTRAILVVHLFGNPCNMDAMAAIARKHNVALIEDCAQTHVTQYKGKYVGTIGDIGCFSFQQSKHMTTGDGGMCVTNNKAYYERMKLYVDKGFMRKGWGTRAYGFHAPNYRMNELTGAVGRAQLKKVKGIVETRHNMGTLMTQLLSDVGDILTAPVTEGAKHSYWLYPIYLKKGELEAFAKSMASAGFWCGAGYTGKPIYLCTESLTAKKTYGTSKFPFDSAFASKSYDYVPGLCPQAEETLTHLVTMPWDESWGEQKVRKAAAAVKDNILKFFGTTSISIGKTAVVSTPVET
ncbi:MAG: DegT/DnrJ/EryC1/StrS family aminotransferase, partial [Candidatus Omnitrophica bacterium]|nr:DegT/DnrJ/EryC1/StrS family aminotransferase [Candidatus Omnitrophota bacterium]